MTGNKESTKLGLKLILDEVGVTKVKHPNKGHTPNKGQKPMYQGVRYSESPLYALCYHL